MKKVIVRLDQNIAQFSPKEGYFINIPLTDIEDAWPDAIGEWNVRFSGCIEGTTYIPLAG